MGGAEGPLGATTLEQRMHGASWLVEVRQYEHEPDRTRGRARVRSLAEREQLLCLVVWQVSYVPPLLPQGQYRDTAKAGRTYGPCQERLGAEPCPRLATHKALRVCALHYERWHSGRSMAAPLQVQRRRGG